MKLTHIAVVGAGTMGAGIAQLAASKGALVRVIDVDGAAVARGLDGIEKRLARSVEKNRITSEERKAVLARIQTGTDIAGLAEIELAIEAVVERLDIKHAVLEELEAATSAEAILATNTSSLSVGRIAEVVSDPSRVVGMHFFNPAVIMPLVEIIAGEKSSTAAVNKAYNAAADWGKTPVRAKDTPGFIVNRVARGFYLEALRLLDEGVAGVAEIDGVVKTHGKFRMGPFELMDLVGLDVNWSVSNSVWQQMGRPARLTPHKIQGSLVKRGKLGRKSGEGFYRYDATGPVAAVEVNRKSFEVNPKLADAMLAFTGRAGAVAANSTEQLIFSRILAAIINEAGFAYEQEVASSADIDIAMEKGTNYPKGPLAWADEIGHHTVRGVLAALNESIDDGRYEPAGLFVR
ncbi:MAG: 3-hydroxyacyl-CoA dehydrogenase NAD-binding domain-containing protein [Phycisphaerae bacterium]